MKFCQFKLVAVILMAFSALPLSSQVTIGSDYPPVDGAAIDLKQDNVVDGANSTKGMILPRVELEAVDVLAPKDGTFTEKDIHTGLWVYNLTENNTLCEGPYVWDGNSWIRLWGECGCEYTIKGSDNIDYHFYCFDFTGIGHEQATRICKGITQGWNTYHLMTADEFTKVYNMPVTRALETDLIGKYKFAKDEVFFVSYLSQVVSQPLGWVTTAYVHNDSPTPADMEVTALYYLTPNKKYFPGGTPIGGRYDTLRIARCIRD